MEKYVRVYRHLNLKLNSFDIVNFLLSLNPLGKNLTGIKPEQDDQYLDVSIRHD